MQKQILGIAFDELEEHGAKFTASEIAGQPDLWKNTWNMISERAEEIENFLAPLFRKDNLQVILTGAGTSAFIGETLEGPFQKHTGVTTRAIATTNLVTHPELYFLKDKPTLLVSFARSGNSPESSKAVSLAKNYCEEIYNLIITCNPEGKLALENSGLNDFKLILPPEANDQSLAMTGSFSAMLLAGLLISRIKEISVLGREVDIIAGYGKKIIDFYSGKLREVAGLPFTRAVFLGSGLFEGVARESHLKLQELSDGKVICKHDTFLGFRHGPKAVIDNETLIVYLFSNNEYSRKYEADLVESVSNGRSGIFSIGVMEHDTCINNLSLKLVMSENSGKVDEDFLTVPSVLPAQIIGFFKSLDLGLEPDNPSKDGVITRVVQGVKLYEYNNVKVNGQI